MATLPRACAGRLRDTAPDKFVFPSGSGERQSTDNMRSRVFGLSLKCAAEKLEAEGFAPLPDGLTPHSLRRTCVSLLLARKKDPGTPATDALDQDASASQRRAEALGVHPQTVRYRVGQLRELLGSALDDPEQRLALALRITV